MWKETKSVRTETEDDLEKRARELHALVWRTDGGEGASIVDQLRAVCAEVEWLLRRSAR